VGVHLAQGVGHGVISAQDHNPAILAFGSFGFAQDTFLIFDWDFFGYRLFHKSIFSIRLLFWKKKHFNPKSKIR
jgi:hypothetical protein